MRAHQRWHRSTRGHSAAEPAAIRLRLRRRQGNLGRLGRDGLLREPDKRDHGPKGPWKMERKCSGLVHAEDWTRDRPGLGLGEVVFDVGSAFTGAGAARTGTRAAGAVADAADEAAPGVRAAVVDNVVAETAPITGRAGSIADNLHDITDDIPTNAAPNPTRPAIPPSLVEPPPNAPMPHGVPESPAPDGPDSTGARVPDSTPLDRAAVGPAASAPVDLTPISPHHSQLLRATRRMHLRPQRRTRRRRQQRTHRHRVRTPPDRPALQNTSRARWRLQIGRMAQAQGSGVVD